MASCLKDFGEDVESAARLPPKPLHGDPLLPEYLPANVSLNSEQQFVFDLVMRHLDTSPEDRSLKIVHIEAAAGSGKTFLCLCLAMAVRQRPAGVASCTAFTAKAASNYPGGHTAHYEFQLNVSTISQQPSTRLVSVADVEGQRSGSGM